MFEAQLLQLSVTLVRLAAAATLSTVLMAAAPSSVATKPISRLDTSWWKLRFQQKQIELKQGTVQLLWLGDSITQNWETDGPQPWRRFTPIWRRFYGDRHAVNLGFRGDSTCHLLWRLQHGELDAINPRAAILLIGANNFGRIHTDAEQTYQGIIAILRTLHRRLPRTQVLLLGVLPSIRSSWVNINTQQLNRRLALLPANEGIWLRFVDVRDVFENGGVIDSSRFLDPLLTPPDPPLHPSASAQAALATKIEPVVASMMGDSIHN